MERNNFLWNGHSHVRQRLPRLSVTAKLQNEVRYFFVGIVKVNWNAGLAPRFALANELRDSTEYGFSARRTARRRKKAFPRPSSFKLPRNAEFVTAKADCQRWGLIVAVPSLALARKRGSWQDRKMCPHSASIRHPPWRPSFHGGPEKPSKCRRACGFYIASHV